MMHQYALVIHWSIVDGCYVAIVPALPGCCAVGDSPEEAARESQDAITAWIEAARKAGNPVPEPVNKQLAQFIRPRKEAA